MLELTENYRRSSYVTVISSRLVSSWHFVSFLVQAAERVDVTHAYSEAKQTTKHACWNPENMKESDIFFHTRKVHEKVDYLMFNIYLVFLFILIFFKRKH